MHQKDRITVTGSANFGGTVEVSTEKTLTPLLVKSNDPRGECYIRFDNLDGVLGYFAFLNDKTPIAYFDGTAHPIGFTTIKSYNRTFGQVVIGTANYTELLISDRPEGTIIGTSMESWSNNSGAFSINIYKGTRAFIVGNSGTVINGLTVTFYYI